ncbi:MAG: glutamate 5-kinase [Sulfobacillus sp.]|nr:glutamate 5-kinase [Sulfobacillus sp.]
MRWVVKIGTSSLCEADGQLSWNKVLMFTRQIKALHERGHQVVVVTSGAIGTGMGTTKIRPKTLSERQALAAIGQAHLMEYYRKALAPITMGQLLLTYPDISDPIRRDIFCQTLEHMLQWRTIPVVNENDAVTDDDSRIGDNDTLAAHLAVMVRANRLVILTDIDGLYTDNPYQNPGAQRIDALPWVTLEHVEQFGAGEPGQFGAGGMATKLQAARIAQEAGIEMVLASSREPGVLQKIDAPNWQGGTRFLARRGVSHA